MADAADKRVFIHGVDRTGRIISVNDEWVDFARENDAPELVRGLVVGRPLWEFIEDRETRHLSRFLLEKALGSGRTMTIPYRCDSPGVRRFFEMKIVPLDDGTVEFRSRCLKTEAREAQPLLERDAARGEGFITICSWCRRIRLGDEWVEADEAVRRLDLFASASLPQLTHGLCASCDSLVRGNAGR